MNPWLILGPSGMVAVGVLSIVFWIRRSRVSLRYFLWGGIMWAVAIVSKIIMDYTVTPPLSSTLVSSFGIVGGLVVIGIYVGLRTGLLECGFTYLATDRTGLKKASSDEATAFGVGFGAAEAILIGLPSLVQLVSFITNPSLIDMIPPDLREAVLAQLDTPTLFVFAPILERAFTLFAHVFTALLVFASVKQRRFQLFLLAFIYKSVLDAVAPYMQWVLSSSYSVATVYLLEGWVVLMGAFGFIGSVRVRRDWI